MLEIRQTLAQRRDGCTCSGQDNDVRRAGVMGERLAYAEAVRQIDDAVAAGLLEDRETSA